MMTELLSHICTDITENMAFSDIVPRLALRVNLCEYFWLEFFGASRCQDMCQVPVEAKHTALSYDALQKNIRIPMDLWTLNLGARTFLRSPKMIDYHFTPPFLGP